MKDFVFRPATPGDYESINRLKVQVHDYHFQHRPDYFNRSDQPLARSYFAGLLNSERYHVFVIETSEKIVAYAITYIITYDSNPLVKEHERLYIEDICVNESNRNQGVGTRLFNELEAFCRTEQLSHIALDVWNFNERAIRFYNEMGMHPVIQRFEKRVG